MITRIALNVFSFSDLQRFTTYIFHIFEGIQLQVSFESAAQYLHFKQIYKDDLLKIDHISDTNVTKKLTIHSKTKALPILSYKGSPLDTLNQLLPIRIEEFVNFFQLRDMDHELCAFNTHNWFYSGDNIKYLEEFDQEYKYARCNNSDLRSYFPFTRSRKNKNKCHTVRKIGFFK